MCTEIPYFYKPRTKKIKNVYVEFLIHEGIRKIEKLLCYPGQKQPGFQKLNMNNIHKPHSTRNMNTK